MKCFYHNDMDGRCSASIVAQYELNKCNQPNKTDYIEVDYTKPIPDVVSKNETVYIVDYSFTEPTLYQLLNILSKTSNVVWCDHHDSTLKLLNNHKELNRIKGIRNIEESGAVLTYMYLFDSTYEECPKYIKLVSDYDCWKFKFGNETIYFKLGIESGPFDALNDVWIKLLLEFKNDTLFELTDIETVGKNIRKYIDMDNKYYLEHFGYESNLDNIKCLVVNEKTNSWIFGKKINEYPICISYVFNGEKYCYTLYSENKNIDCSKIAEKYGGGGHKGSAGFISDELLFKKL